jgi:hypothetical protein
MRPIHKEDSMEIAVRLLRERQAERVAEQAERDAARAHEPQEVAGAAVDRVEQLQRALAAAEARGIEMAEEVGRLTGISSLPHKGSWFLPLMIGATFGVAGGLFLSYAFEPTRRGALNDVRAGLDSNPSPSTSAATSPTTPPTPNAATSPTAPPAPTAATSPTTPPAPTAATSPTGATGATVTTTIPKAPTAATTPASTTLPNDEPAPAPATAGATHRKAKRSPAKEARSTTDETDKTDQAERDAKTSESDDDPLSGLAR